MGFFSWVTSDTHKSISNMYSSRGALPVYLLLPDDAGDLLGLDDDYLYEPCYEGYGEFGGEDAFIILAKINLLLDENLDGLYGMSALNKSKAIRFQRWLKTGEESGEPNVYDDPESFRNLGISMFYDCENLRYPLKFTEKLLPYDSVKASEDCDDQGYFYGCDDDEDEYEWYEYDECEYDEHE